MNQRDEFIESVKELASDIGVAVMEDPLDRDKLLSLTALGVQSCLVGVATLMQETDEQAEGFTTGPDDLQQLFLFPDPQ